MDGYLADVGAPVNMRKLALGSLLLLLLAGCASNEISAEDQAAKSTKLDQIAKTNPGSVGMDK